MKDKRYQIELIPTNIDNDYVDAMDIKVLMRVLEQEQTGTYDSEASMCDDVSNLIICTHHYGLKDTETQLLVSMCFLNITTVCDTTVVTISILSTLSEYRGRGLTKEFVNEILDKLKSMDVTGNGISVTVDCYKENITAIELYRTLGFDPVPDDVVTLHKTFATNNTHVVKEECGDIS